MDTYGISNGIKYYAPNPNYDNTTKKYGAKPFIPTTDPNFDITNSLVSQYTKNGGVSQEINTGFTNEQLAEYGITPNNVSSVNDDLAENQSNWSKAFNALSQTVVSELGIGTVKAFTDIFDGLVNGLGSAFFDTKNNYINPVSEILEEWKEKFDNDVAPIYVEEGVDIFNGGFSNFGWYMKNVPSIASSITLLIPGKALTAGTAKVLGAVTKGRATAKALRGLRKVTGIENLTSTQNINRVKAAEEMIGTGILMRTAENYQEARGTYKDMKDEVINKFNNMTPEEYKEWCDNHKDYIEKNQLNPNNKEDIADRIASTAANETFRDDFSNVFFDIAQLWGLRDAGKILRNVKSTKIMADHRASIQALGKSSEEIADAAAKSTKFNRLGNTLKDIALGTGKATFYESTEGIEEAVNYIAQQEGITVGKSILDDLNPTTFGDRLFTYISDAQLWESAFWGLAGGVVFHGLGSAYNQIEAKRSNAKEAEKRKENDKTGEKIETSKWYELEELPEIKRARQAIKGRQARVEDMFNKMSQINEGINVFGKRDPTTKELPKYEGSADAIALQQERSRSSVEDEFVADITVDAIHSGTYDMLTEYFGSPEMVKAMAKKLNISDSQATSFVNRILNKSKNVKDEYTKQINHITDQVTAINNNRKTKDPVPLPYIQILAKQNLDRILYNKNLDNQSNIIQEQINALESNPALDGILNRSINYEDVMTIGSITNSYTHYEAQKKAIQADTELGVLDKKIRIDNINRKQQILLNHLESLTEINGKKSSPLGRILYTLKAAQSVKYDESGNLVVDENAIEKTDKEILKEHGFTVTDTEVEDAVKQSSEYQDTLSAFDNLIELSKKEINEADKIGKQLKEISDQIYTRYKQIADIRIGKILNSSDIAISKAQIAEQIDIIHNRNNKNRLAMIKKAEAKLLDLYTRYERPVIDNLIAIALDGCQEQAKALAKEQLKDKNDDAVMFEDAFDILNINSDNNTQLASYIVRLIDGKEWREHIERLKNEQKEKSSTSENQNQANENGQPINQSNTQTETSNEQKTPLNQNENNQGQPIETQNQESTPSEESNSNIVIPNGAIPVKQQSDNTSLTENDVASVEWNNGNVIEYNFKGINIGNRSMPLEEFIKLTGVDPTQTSSTGGQEANPTLDTLKASLNQNFDYLEIKGEDDIEANKDFDIEKAVNTVREAGLNQIESFSVIDGVTITDEAKNELKAILEDRVKALRQRLTKFKEELNKEDSTLDDAASALAMASKIGIIGHKEQLPNIFVVGFEHFIDNYIKTAITPIKDGKKIISVQEILGIVSDSVADLAIVDYLIDKMRTYLNSPEIADKYIILDKDNLNKDFNTQNATKDNKEIEHQNEQFRVNIIDHVDFYTSENSEPNERKKFFDVLNNLRKGDTLDLVVDGNQLFIKSGETVIGSISKATFENNRFLKINKGWVEDVAVNAGGDIVSDAMETYRRILTSDDKMFVELREIILDAIVTGEITDKNIDDFINSDFIQSAINFDDSIIPNGGENIEKNAKSMIEHLVRIYNYSTQGVSFKNKQERINNINYAIGNYFASLYNDFDTLNRINKDTKIRIEYINDGQVNTKFESGTNHHDDLPFISAAIVQSKAKLGVFSQASPNGTTISGEKNGPVPPKAPKMLKVLAMYDRNGAISYVTVKQLKASDYASSPGYQKIYALASNHLRNLLEKAISSNNEQTFNELAQAISDIIYNNNNNNDSDVIPLFVGLPGKGANFKYDKNKSINLYFFYNKNNNEKPTSFNIVKSKKGFTFNYTINGTKYVIKSENSNFEEQVIRILMDIIKNNSTVNIDTNGINSDNNPSRNINRGFVHRNNGKIEVFGEEYDSYNDFIINNGLARVNLNEPQNGSNFISRGREQRLNQVMYVSVNTTLPVEENVDTTKHSVTRPSNKTTDDEVFNKVLKVFENTTVSGKDLFIAAYDQEAYDDMLNIAGEFNIMEAILPLNIIYNSNLNSARSSTLEAKTNPTNHTIRVNVGSDKTPSGRTRVQLSPGQVMVGDKFISMISSTKGPLRNRAIAVMIHERLHWLIENNPNYTRKQILDAIAPIYDEFFKLCQEVVDNYNKDTASPAEKLKYLRAKKAIDDFKRYKNKKTYPDPLTKFDEFLVETITNTDYNALMNDFKATQKVEKGEDNIFTKLLKFVMKYLFNREIKNNSLLEQEFNTLSNLLNNKQITIPAEQKTVVTVSESTTRNRPTIRKVVTNIRRPGDTNSSRFNDFKNRHDNDSALGILEQYSSESITGFISTLPIEQQVKFNSLINNGQLEYTCSIK